MRISLFSILILSSCSHLTLKNPRVKSEVRVLDLATVQLTAEASPKVWAGTTFGQHPVYEKKPWQWRGRDSVGAPAESFVSPMFLGGDDLLVATLGGGLSLLSIKTGAVRWTLPVAIGVAATPYVSGSSVFVAGMDAQVRKLKLSNGEVEWTSPISAESLGGIAASGGMLYVSTGDDALWALDEKTGKSLWTYKRPGPDSSVYWSLRGTSMPLLSADAKKIFIGFSDGAFVCLESVSGQTVWERRFDKSGRFKDVDTTPVLSVDGKLVFVSLVDGEMMALKTADGATAWTTPGASAYSPALDSKDKALYLSTADGYLQRISLEDTRIQWSLSLQGRGPATTPVMIGEKHLAVTTVHGAVLIVNRESGRIVWERNLAYGVLAPVAFDGRRMVVLSSRNRLHIHRVDEIL